jgi:hypothetical protein
MLVYFMAIGNILWPFGICIPIVVICYIFSPFWYVVPREIWQPCLRVTCYNEANLAAKKGVLGRAQSQARLGQGVGLGLQPNFLIT